MFANFRTRSALILIASAVTISKIPFFVGAQPDISEGTDARCPSAGEDVQTYVFTSSNIRRCFQVYKPSGASAAPVMIMAHGANGNSRSFCGNKGNKKRFAALGAALICTGDYILSRGVLIELFSCNLSYRISSAFQPPLPLKAIKNRDGANLSSAARF